MTENQRIILALASELRRILLATKEIGDTVHLISQDVEQIAFFDKKVSDIAQACVQISGLAEGFIESGVDNERESGAD